MPQPLLTDFFEVFKMSAKLIENLPSKDLPWFRRYTDGKIGTRVEDIYAQDHSYKEHFNLNKTDFMTSRIALNNARTIDLLRINECGYMELFHLKKWAAEYKTELDNAWGEIQNNPDWNFYYINKDSGLSRDVYDILNTILDYQIVI